MKKAKILILPLVIVSLATGGYLNREKIMEIVHSQDKNTSSLNATGTIEIQEVDISSKLSGYISKLLVEESDQVKEGELLAVIDRPDLSARLDANKASQEQAKALLEDIRKGARTEEIAEIDAKIQAGLSRYNQAKRDYERYLRLYEDKVVSAKKMEESRLLRNVTLEELRALRERKKILQQGARDDRIRAQQEEINKLEANLRVTETEIADTKIKSPLSGIVLLQNFEKGELVSPGSIILTLGDYKDCWINIYIPSTMLGFVFPGQSVSVRVDSWPEQLFKGKVSEIAEKAEYTPRASITPEERANLVFRVKISLDNSERLFKPGMPADVVIQKKGSE